MRHWKKKGAVVHPQLGRNFPQLGRNFPQPAAIWKNVPSSPQIPDILQP